MPDPSPARRLVLVLGMHRSGTSALSRAVTLLGAAAPATLMPAAPDNPRGFWESAVLAAINDRILAAGGSRWDDWRGFDPGVLDPALRALLEREMAAGLRREFGQAGLMVLKDPRLSRLLPLWRPVLAGQGIAAGAIIALRHPGAVAASLARRNAMAPNTAALLWLRHVLDAEHRTRDMPRALVSFDALLRDWRGALAGAGAALGIAWPHDPAGVATDFLQARPPDPQAGPQAGSAYAEVWCRHAWQALRALEAGDPAGSATLDRVREQFEDACRLFAGPPAAPPPRTPLNPSSGRVPPEAPPPPASSDAPSRRARPVLPQVTLCAADSSRTELTARALARCAAQCDFADIVLFTDRPAPPGMRVQPIAALRSRADYSDFMLRQLVGHCATSHVLVAQWDGFVTQPASWDPAFLAFDYVGARWGWHADGADVGNGGFSLRSRRLLDALHDPRLVPRPGVPEDELICRVWRPMLERDHAIRFAPAGVADRFSYERVPPRGPTFGFHGLFNVWRHLDDAALAELVALLPADVLRGREFAELAGLCFLAGRRAVLPALLAAWRGAQTLADMRRALGQVLRQDALVTAWLRDAGA